MKLSPTDLETISAVTIEHYESNSVSFWEGTKDHDVTQNYAAFLEALPQDRPLKILDFGSGPGRDVAYFKSLGHFPTGLDGCPAFCRRITETTGCPALNQNFLKLDLPARAFDGVFANASLFHIPSQELPRVLGELKTALVEGGILFSSNPRGNAEGWSGSRYGTYLEFETYERLLTEGGFEALHHYYRPADLPRHQQPWLAVLSRSKP